MKSVIVIFCIAGTLVGWLATHLGTTTKVVRSVGDGWAPGPIPAVQSKALPKTVPVNAKKAPDRSHD